VKVVPGCADVRRDHLLAGVISWRPSPTVSPIVGGFGLRVSISSGRAARTSTPCFAESNEQANVTTGAAAFDTSGLTSASKRPSLTAHE
jgi:hypothetical protein